MKKIERNAPCPCGSGKKYKQCCLKRDEALAASRRAETAAVSNALKAALEHYHAGRLLQAEAIYQQVLQADPHHPEALHFLGVIALHRGRNEIAIELIGKALLFKPDYAEAHNNLGLVLKDQGMLVEAVEHYQQALSIKPNFAEAHNNLGIALKDQGQLDKAVWHYHEALSIKPDFALAHSNFGFALQAQGKLDEAVEQCCKAIALKPDFAEAHANLGSALQKQGKLAETVEHYRKALSLKPDFTEAHSNLGVVLQAQGKLDEAVGHYYQALSINPNYAEAHNNLALALQAEGKLDEALESYHKALSINQNYVEAYNNQGNTFKDQGRLNEAIESYHRAILLKPDYVEARSNLLYALNFHADLSREEIYRAAQEYEALIGQPLRSTWQEHNNDKNPNRRLRIGYISPDFRNHAVAYFAEPILSNHDKSQVEIYCYAEVMLEDEITDRFRHYADHWHSTVGLSDEAVAQMVREPRIDILVDLAGHTAKNRLPTFARKPAPVQITYLGYLGTTGLSAMDYILIDHHVEPEGIADAGYSEHLLRLPDSLWCYRPSADAPEISPLPALARGYLTFGSFNNFNKVDQSTLELWAELLWVLPTSRLMMLSVPEGEARLRLTHYFVNLGIDAERLEFHGKLPIAEFRHKLLEVDITLDPVTVNGATTTCESLWMGVPVLSLVGVRFPSRAGLSILSTVGLSDFVAHTREDYFHLAVHLADNLELLAEIRTGLRAHVATSPLIDEIGFTRNLESLYRDVWGKWCGVT